MPIAGDVDVRRSSIGSMSDEGTVPGRICLLHPGQPGIDLADPEPQLAADAESRWTATLAAQVVKRLDTDLQAGGQLGQGQDRLKGFSVLVSMHGRCASTPETCRKRPSAMPSQSEEDDEVPSIRRAGPWLRSCDCSSRRIGMAPPWWFGGPGDRGWAAMPTT